jgi:hypothetical protein
MFEGQARCLRVRRVETKSDCQDGLRRARPVFMWLVVNSEFDIDPPPHLRCSATPPQQKRQPHVCRLGEQDGATETNLDRGTDWFDIEVLVKVVVKVLPSNGSAARLRILRYSVAGVSGRVCLHPGTEQSLPAS